MEILFLGVRDGPGEGPRLAALLAALLRSPALLRSLLRSRDRIDSVVESRVTVLVLELSTFSGGAGADSLRRINRLWLVVSETIDLASEYDVVGVADMLSLEE